MAIWFLFAFALQANIGIATSTTTSPCVKGCDAKCKVPGGLNRGACCAQDKPGCSIKTVDFDTRTMLTHPKAMNNLGGYGPDKDVNGKLTIDGGTLPKLMRFPEAGSFIDTDNLNGVANAKITFDVVISVVTKSASGRTGGPYKPRNADYNGIYKPSKFDVGDKADIVEINFGPFYIFWCR